MTVQNAARKSPVIATKRSYHPVRASVERRNVCTYLSRFGIAKLVTECKLNNGQLIRLKATELDHTVHIIKSESPRRNYLLLVAVRLLSTNFEDMGDSTKRRAAAVGNDSAGRKKSRVSQHMPKHLLRGQARLSAFL